MKTKNGFILTWNKKNRKRADDITFFVKHKDIKEGKSYPIRCWDISSYLMRAIKEIEK